MDHHTQAFFSRCEPPPLHPRCIPVFGSCPTDGEDPQAPNPEYYMSSVDHQHQRQLELQQLHHGTYETPDEYRSPSYAYYASCGPPPYYVESESGGTSTHGVPGNLHSSGLELPMRSDVSMGRYIQQRAASSSSPVYASQQQIIASAPCASVGLPLAPEVWPGHSVTNGLPMLHRGRESFELADPRQLPLQHHAIEEERPGFDWLPVVPSNTATPHSAFVSRFHQSTGGAEMKEQEQGLVDPGDADVVKARARTSRVVRSKSKKDSGNSDGPVPKFQCFLCAKQYCRRR